MIGRLLAGVRITSIVIASMLAVLATRAHAQSPTGDGMLRVASSGDHVWVVVPTPGAGGMQGARIMHHAADMGPLGMRQAFEFARPVVDLVATGDRLWIVFGPEQGRPGEPVFDVASSTVRRNMAVGTYYDLPLGSMKLEPQVAADGWRGMAALPGSPAVARRSQSGIELVRPTATSWSPVEVPTDLPDGTWLVPWPVQGQPSAALAAIEGDALRTWTRLGDQWTSQRWPVPSAAVHVVPGASRPTVVQLGRVDGNWFRSLRRALSSPMSSTSMPIRGASPAEAIASSSSACAARNSSCRCSAWMDRRRQPPSP